MLLISRVFRKMNDIPTPIVCHALKHIPESLQDICDCKEHCKYKPHDGGYRIYQNVNTNHTHTVCK